MALTPERRAEIRARHQALTNHTIAGDWHYDGADAIHVFPADGHAEVVATVWGGEPDSAEEKALGEFIAAARRDVPDLFAEVERLHEAGRAQSAMCMAAELERDARLPAKVVERFLERERDQYAKTSYLWRSLNGALDAFRFHLVTGTPLTSPHPTEGPEAPFVGAEPLTEAEELRAEAERLRELVKDLADPDPCWYDHHGYCQAHGWTETEPRCPHARAQDLLAAREATSDG